MKIHIGGRDVTQYVRGFSFAEPITATYRPDGSLRTVQIDYWAANSRQREDIAEWVKAHRIDPGMVPIQVEIGYDPATDEWCFPVHVRGRRGAKQIDMATGEPKLRVVRRQRQAAPGHHPVQRKAHCR